MKRIKSACICQTLHFMMKDDLSNEYGRTLAKKELEQYKKGMDRKHTKYKILEEQEQPDGSIIVKVIKQYNMSPVGDYLN